MEGVRPVWRTQTTSPETTAHAEDKGEVRVTRNGPLPRVRLLESAA